jgi:DNA-binding response OmpR family regulator
MEGNRMAFDERAEKTMRVAVIDDDPDILKVLRVILGARGIEVQEALSGLKGFVMVKREPPDVVLLDIMMPDIDGFEVLRKLKLDPETADVPVIFLSAKTGKEHVDRGLSLGAQGYVTKPFDPEQLVDMIEEVAGWRMPETEAGD